MIPVAGTIRVRYRISFDAAPVAGALDPDVRGLVHVPEIQDWAPYMGAVVGGADDFEQSRNMDSIQMGWGRDVFTAEPGARTQHRFELRLRSNP